MCGCGDQISIAFQSQSDVAATALWYGLTNSQILVRNQPDMFGVQSFHTVFYNFSQIIHRIEVNPPDTKFEFLVGKRDSR